MAERLHQTVTVTLVFSLPVDTIGADEPIDHDTLDWLQENFELVSLEGEVK